MTPNLKLLLTRLVDNKQQTTGNLLLYSDINSIAHFRTLELAWKNNEKRISCIPPGEYICKVRYSDKYGRHLIVEDVEGRSFILFHHGNFNKNTLGCILVGEKFAKINKDDLFDITNSRKSMLKLMSYIEDDQEIELTITEALISL